MGGRRRREEEEGGRGRREEEGGGRGRRRREEEGGGRRREEEGGGVERRVICPIQPTSGYSMSTLSWHDHKCGKRGMHLAKPEIN